MGRIEHFCGFCCLIVIVSTGLSGCSSSQRRTGEAQDHSSVQSSNDGESPFELSKINRADLSGASERFSFHLSKNPELTFEQTLELAGGRRDFREKLSFDPTSARYFRTIKKALDMSREENEIFEKNGFVSIDHGQPYSMGGMYYAIYVRDLPVLVTTDSILHALHRSYDDILKHLEMALFLPTMEGILNSAHDTLISRSERAENNQFAENFRDVDLYLTVARNLVLGAGAESGDGELLVNSRLGQNEKVSEMLDLVASLGLQRRGAGSTELYGGTRRIDFSQFRPRGHYNDSEDLRRYFRAMMWLGRADLGWVVIQPPEESGVFVDSDREIRNSILLTQILEESGMNHRLNAISDIIDFMVGRSDNLTNEELGELLEGEESDGLDSFDDAEDLERLREAIVRTGYGSSQIRSQVVETYETPGYQTESPVIFQVFGQRFILDSYVFSQVVYDSILYQERRQRRMMPSGLDVMAALGNNEAVSLLEPEIREFHYGANLMATRAMIEEYVPEVWSENLYMLWLDSLRVLDEDYSHVENFPEVMETETWQKRQLNTQLASWSELRHDTLLYGKQSYTAYPACEYPEGYVEPYPEFFKKIKFFATKASQLLGRADVSSDDAAISQRMKNIQERQVKFFNNFAETVGTLEQLATKELKAVRFNRREEEFLAKVIDRRGGGSGPPQYDGWYPELFYSGEPDSWQPTVADVHTDPLSGEVLEVGVGNANFLVVAIDNEDDHVAYVGPTYSYYEFREKASNRLTDQEWRQRIREEKLPPRPSWTSSYQAKTVKRSLGR